MSLCQHCGARVDNGLGLCDLCQRKAVTILEYLPVYFHNLARWRPGRTGSRKVPGSVVLYDGTFDRIGTGDRISDALDDTLGSLTRRAHQLTETRAFPRPHTWPDAVITNDLPPDLAEQLVDQPALRVDALCVGFIRHLTAIATRDWCADFIVDLDHHETRLRGFTEALVPGWYAGSCRTCDAPTYVVPGLTWVTCRVCGSTTYARDHLDIVLDEARDWLASPRRIAEAIVALVDTEQSVPRLQERIKKWQQRGRLEGTWRTERTWDWDEDLETMVIRIKTIGHPRYRLGDVVDLLFTEGTTRLPRQSTSQA